LCSQTSEDLVTRSRLRWRVLVALIFAAAAYAMVLLGDVREIEKVRERSRHRQRPLRRCRREQPRQLIKVFRMPGPRALRQRAHALHHFVQLDAFVLAQRLAEEVTEKVDVIAEGLVHSTLIRSCRDGATGDTGMPLMVQRIQRVQHRRRQQPKALLFL